MGIPVSTTYVGFAAVLATGWGDKVFAGGDSEKKAGRAIWVIFCWFLGGAIAMSAAAVVAKMIHSWQLAGLAVAVAMNLFARWYFDRKSEDHEQKYHKTDKPVPVP